MEAPVVHRVLSGERKVATGLCPTAAAGSQLPSAGRINACHESGFTASADIASTELSPELTGHWIRAKGRTGEILLSRASGKKDPSHSLVLCPN